MTALKPGTRAPEVKLPLFNGGSFDLGEALKKGPVLLAFFKISCPVCQFTFPYVERIHKAVPNAQIVGVSQDDQKATASFAREYGLTFPIALDDTRSYPVSNAYGLTNVPTLFAVSADGTIGISSVGWSRADMQLVADTLAKAQGKPPSPVFQKSESIPDFKAG